VSGALPPPGPPPPYAYGPRTNSLAIASLVTAILSWVLCPLLAAILAVIFGHVARGQIKQTGEGGAGMALAGLIVGYSNIGCSVLFIVVYILIFGVAIFFAAMNGVSVTPSPTP
jgi:Domain of unknown function (DUF4190)